MATTFGGTTGDDITHTLGGTSSNGASSSCQLVTGWWYPTTLTSGRTYRSLSASHSIRIDSTTSEIDVTVDRATTDAVWTSTTAGLVVDAWNFLALLISMSSGGAPTMRLWTSPNGQIPTEKAIALAVAGSGAGTATGAVAIGNTGSAGINAWQGDVGQVHTMHSSSPDGVLPHATAGTITQEEADRIFNTLVLPLFLGDFPNLFVRGSNRFNSIISTSVMFDLETIGPSIIMYGKGALGMLSQTTVPATQNGIAVSARRQQGQLIDIGRLAKCNAMRRR